MAPAPRNHHSPSGSSGGEVAYHDDDAALARALQEEYEKEYRRRGMQQHLNLGPVEFTEAFPSAPTESFAADDGFGADPFYSPNSQDHSFNAFGDDTYQSIEVSDEAFARQLEQQMVEEALKRQKQRKEAEARRLAAERGATATAHNRATAPARSTSAQRLPPSRDNSMTVAAAAPEAAPRRVTSSQQQRSSPPSRDNSFQQQRSSRSLNRNNSSRNINNNNAAAGGAAAAASRARSRSRNPPSRDNSLNRGAPRSSSRNPPPSRENSLHRASSQSRLTATSRSHSQRSLNNRSERSRTAPARSSSGAARRPPSRSNSSASQQRYNSSSSNGLSMAPAAVLTLADFQVLSDEELAKRLEAEEVQARIAQEEHDGEVARQWLVEEQIRRSASEAQRLARPKPKCTTCRRLFSCLVALLVIGAGAALLLVFLGKGGAVGDVFIPDPQAFREEDPFNNNNPDDANLWRSGGQGLELTVINAMEEHWHEFFDNSVSQWDNGTPDALSLSVKYEDAQSLCRAQDGALKVCNGDYGDTNWRGINKVMLQNNWIISSAARMNEYYLTRDYKTDYPQMMYTVCHEVGHGFGLPHTDENFFNSNLGNW